MRSLLYHNWTDPDAPDEGGVPAIDPPVMDYIEQFQLTDKRLAEESLVYFCNYYLGSAVTDAFAEAHYEVCRFLQEQRDPGNPKRILCMWPREHGKTTLMTLSFVLWNICYRKKRNVVICSDSKIQAKEFLRNIKTELEVNETIRRDFGELVPNTSTKGGRYGKWDETHVITANGVQIKLISPGTQTRGLQFNVRVTMPNGRVRSYIQRPDLLILDDILNDKWIKNRLQRDKLEEWFFSPVFNAADSMNGDIVIVGTVLHNDDLLERLWKDEDRTRQWLKMRKPACRIVDGEITEPLWPARWNAEKLKRRRVEIGSLAFAREFLLQPLDEGAQFFHKDWFRFYIHQDIPQTWHPQLMERGYELLPPDMLVCTGIDPAISQKDEANYTAVVTLGFSPSQRKYYVLDVFQDRCSPQTQVKEMIRQCRRWDKTLNDGNGFVHTGFAVETYAYQESLGYWLKKELEDQGLIGYRIYRRNEYALDKYTRISGMSPMVEQNRLYFPLGLKRDPITDQQFLSWPFQKLQDEMHDFPGATLDIVDAAQRCYSVLVVEERRYVYSGQYGTDAISGFDALLSSHKHLQQYMGEPRRAA